MDVFCFRVLLNIVDKQTQFVLNSYNFPYILIITPPQSGSIRAIRRSQFSNCCFMYTIVFPMLPFSVYVFPYFLLFCFFELPFWGEGRGQRRRRRKNFPKTSTPQSQSTQGRNIPFGHTLHFDNAMACRYSNQFGLLSP